MILFTLSRHFMVAAWHFIWQTRQISRQMTFCRNYGQKHVTSFARLAHIPYVSYETGPQADVDQAASV